METDNVLLKKSEGLLYCLGRLRSIYAQDSQNLHSDLTKQEAILLNLQRACEASIDLAMYLVSKLDLTVPSTSRAAFEELAKVGLISSDLLMRMKKMVSFRNIAIHNYVKLDLNVVQTVIEENLGDFEEFLKAINTLHKQ